MVGFIELDAKGERLVIRFPYRKELVELVKQLPGRRWDPQQKLWTVPATETEQAVAVFEPHGFDVSALGLGTGGRGNSESAAAKPPADGLFAPAAVTDEAGAPAAMSISVLNQRVRGALQAAFSTDLWVVGEIMDLDKARGRRHWFFSLVEKAPGDDTRPIARVEVALFESSLELLQRKLASADPPLQLRDGIEVRVLGRVDFYPATGRFQLIIQDIDPSHTLGKLALNREQILRELRGLGLERRNAARPMPAPAMRIGVLTSDSSDGWSDFQKQLQASGLAFAVTCYPVRVQGTELRPTMLAGLGWFAARAAEHDVVCILRGGGSRTDLSWFDDRDLALAVAQHPLKILVGIGHERDRSVLDCIAASFKTPTAVAAHLAEAARDELDAVHDKAVRLGDLARAALVDAKLDLRDRARGLRRAVDGMLGSAREVLGVATDRVVRGSGWLLRRRAERLGEIGVRLRRATLLHLERQGQQLERRELRLRLLDPRQVVARGYGLVRRAEDGHILKEAGQVSTGELLDVEFRDGVVRTRTEGVTIRNPESA